MNPAIAIENTNAAYSDLVMQAENCTFKRLEGVLRKKNSKGQWKDRVCILTDETFTAFKSNKKGDTSDAKEYFDVKVLDSVTVTDDMMELKLINGEVYLFRSAAVKTRRPLSQTAADAKAQYSNDVNDWKAALLSRIEWALAKVSTAVTKADKIHISGWLAKKSHNKYQLQLQVSWSTHQLY